MKLWVKIFIAMGLGILAGIIFGEQTVWLKPIGTLFLNLISMIIVPLVLSTMTVGLTGFQDRQKIGRIGAKASAFYIASTVVAISLGLFFGFLFNIGGDLSLQMPEGQAVVEAPSFSAILLSLVPSNPIAAFASANVLQIVVFSLFLGLAIQICGEKGAPVRKFMSSLADVMYALTSMIMEFSPIGVFAIMAWVAGSFGAHVLLPLAQFVFVYYLACLIQLFAVYGTILVLFGGLMPRPFFRGMRDAMMLAFSTCSSSATLPVTIACVQNNLGVSKNVASFVLPLGTTLHMAGAALFQAMSAVFISHAYGIHLDLTSLMTIVFMAVLGSIGAAGIPGTGFIMLSAVLSSVGLPLEGLAILAGIDRIREMGSTLTNVIGEAAVTVVIAKQENELDEAVYYSQETIPQEVL